MNVDLDAEVASILRSHAAEAHVSEGEIVDRAIRAYDLRSLVARIRSRSDLPGPHRAVCRDPRDDYLIALAEASGAEAIISGDLDLLAIDPARIAVEVVTPRQFADQLG